METTYTCIDRWMDKEDTYICTVEYYSAMKKNEMIPFAATWMELEIIIQTEVRQKEKDRQHMTLFITGIESRLVVAKGEEIGGRMNGRFGLADVRFIYRMDKQQGPTVQHRELHSISYNKHYIQYCVINHNKDVYMYTESLHCMAGVDTKL